MDVYGKTNLEAELADLEHIIEIKRRRAEKIRKKLNLKKSCLLELYLTFKAKELEYKDSESKEALTKAKELSKEASERFGVVLKKCYIEDGKLQKVTI